MHSRLAAGLILQAKANPATVDTLRIAQHLNAARDGARAAPLWKHATEAALSRRALRDAVACTRGWSEALGLMRSSDSAVLRARVDGLARAACIALSLQDAALARTVVDEATTLATPSGLNSAELSLALAGVQRTEARRAKAAEALAVAAQLAQGHPLAALVEAERGEAREQEGDLAGALAAYESALTLAPAARDLSRWHGEIDLSARLEARLGGLALQRKDFTAAQQRFESSLEKWRHAAWPFAEARVLANLGTTCVLMKDSSRAPAYFSAAAQAAARCGDLLFQARMLLQQAKAAKLTGEASAARAIASEARKLCGELDWGEGRSQAEALASS